MSALSAACVELVGEFWAKAVAFWDNHLNAKATELMGVAPPKSLVDSTKICSDEALRKSLEDTQRLRRHAPAALSSEVGGGSGRRVGGRSGFGGSEGRRVGWSRHVVAEVRRFPGVDGGGRRTGGLKTDVGGRRVGGRRRIGGDGEGCRRIGDGCRRSEGQRLLLLIRLVAVVA
eukprot:9467561-Pyramimonas_sp.AAC.1